MPCKNHAKTVVCSGRVTPVSELWIRKKCFIPLKNICSYKCSVMDNNFHFIIWWCSLFLKSCLQWWWCHADGIYTMVLRETTNKEWVRRPHSKNHQRWVWWKEFIMSMNKQVCGGEVWMKTLTSIMCPSWNCGSKSNIPAAVISKVWF